MSFLNIRNVVTLSEPLPNVVWAAICAILLLAVLMRLGRASLPESISGHGGKLWLIVFGLCLFAIAAVFVAPNAPTPGNRFRQDAAMPSPIETSQLPAGRVSALTPPAFIDERMRDCIASRNEPEGVQVVANAAGKPIIVARRSLVEMDATKRFTALKIVEEGAKADLIRHAQQYIQTGRQTSDAARSIEFNEVIRSLASGNLTGVRTIQSCYVDGLAWVKLTQLSSDL